MKDGLFALGITLGILVAMLCFGLAFVTLQGCVIERSSAVEPAEATVGLPIELRCTEACENMARLVCPGFDGSPGRDGERGTVDDVSCAQACLRVESLGEGFTFHTECVAAAETCAAVERCSEED